MVFFVCCYVSFYVTDHEVVFGTVSKQWQNKIHQILNLNLKINQKVEMVELKPEFDIIFTNTNPIFGFMLILFLDYVWLKAKIKQRNWNKNDRNYIPNLLYTFVFSGVFQKAY